MDPRGAGGCELPGDHGGVVGVDLLSGEISLAEANDTAVAQVDGGQDQECC